MMDNYSKRLIGSLIQAKQKSTISNYKVILQNNGKK